MQPNIFIGIIPGIILFIMKTTSFLWNSYFYCSKFLKYFVKNQNFSMETPEWNSE